VAYKNKEGVANPNTPCGKKENLSIKTGRYVLGTAKTGNKGLGRGNGSGKKNTEKRPDRENNFRHQGRGKRGEKSREP